MEPPGVLRCGHPVKQSDEAISNVFVLTMEITTHFSETDYLGLFDKSLISQMKGLHQKRIPRFDPPLTSEQMTPFLLRHPTQKHG